MRRAATRIYWWLLFGSLLRKWHWERWLWHVLFESIQNYRCRYLKVLFTKPRLGLQLKIRENSWRFEYESGSSISEAIYNTSDAFIWKEKHRFFNAIWSMKAKVGHDTSNLYALISPLVTLNWHCLVLAVIPSAVILPYCISVVARLFCFKCHKIWPK